MPSPGDIGQDEGRHRAPELVRSLTIVNSGPAMPVRTLAQRMMIWTRIAIVRVRGMRNMGEVLAGRLLPKPEHAALRAQFIERWATNDPTAYLCALKGLVNWDVIAAIERIDCPVLVLAADRRPIGRHDDETRRIARVRPTSRRTGRHGSGPSAEFVTSTPFAPSRFLAPICQPAGLSCVLPHRSTLPVLSFCHSLRCESSTPEHGDC